MSLTEVTELPEHNSNFSGCEPEAGFGYKTIYRVFNMSFGTVQFTIENGKSVVPLQIYPRLGNT